MNALWHSPGTEAVTANMDAYFAFSFQAGSIRLSDPMLSDGYTLVACGVFIPSWFD